MVNGCCTLAHDVSTADLPQTVFDVVIIGAGIAGLSAALSLDPKLRIALVHKGSAPESSTYRAQGGVSAAVGHDDSPEEHIKDTLRVGQGLCRREAVEMMAREGPDAIAYLLSLGVDFNRSQDELSLTKEAGHSRKRVVHYYDATGRHISEALTMELSQRQNIEAMHGSFLVDLLMRDGTCCGCILWQNGRLSVVRAQRVIIATGGYSGIFGRTTNHTSVTGDGIAAAYRAGAAIADMEFVQFHPTAFTTLSGEVFLLTEALRGEGAVLVNAAGERFMFNYHPDGELAPRDEVSRAIANEIKQNGQKSVYLDARKFGKDYLVDRFRQVYSRLAENDCFMERDLIPVAPAAHYAIGGIFTDLWGRTTIPNLYACGETAATGVHGANRLASNSLLEGIVFGRRAAQDINGTEVGKLLSVPSIKCCSLQYMTGSRELEKELDSVAGVVRNGQEMSALLKKVRENVSTRAAYESIIDYQDHNACQLAILLLEGALLRTESRGTHFRADYPHKDEMFSEKHIIHRWGREAILYDE